MGGDRPLDLAGVRSDSMVDGDLLGGHRGGVVVLHTVAAVLLAITGEA